MTMTWRARRVLGFLSICAFLCSSRFVVGSLRCVGRLDSYSHQTSFLALLFSCNPGPLKALELTAFPISGGPLYMVRYPLGNMQVCNFLNVEVLNVFDH